MKEYIHNFNNEQEYQAYINEHYEEPFVGGVRPKTNESFKKMVFNLHEEEHPEAVPLTFEITKSGNIKWSKSNSELESKTITYSRNGGKTWETITSTVSGSVIPVESGETIIFLGDNDYYGDSGTNEYSSGFTGSFKNTDCWFKLKGNMVSLINSHSYSILKLTSDNRHTFANLFTDCSGLTHTHELITTTNTAVKSQYFRCFKNCINLTTAPTLNHKKLSATAYGDMFVNCWSLSTAPEILAEETSSDSLGLMFGGCTALTSAQARFYFTKYNGWADLERMFDGCISLVQAPELPNIKPATGTFIAMFKNCWSLRTAPALASNTLSTSAYTQMFENCTGLTSAPELSASALTDYCYYEMFKGCSQLSAITMLASSNLSATDALTNWVSGVSPTGVFVKEMYVTLPTGNNGIPQGWLALSNGISLSKNRIDCESGTTETITVTSLNSWSATTAYNWITVAPTAGTSGETTVTVTIPDTQIQRSGVVLFSDGTNEQALVVVQSHETDYSKMPLTFNVLNSGTILWKSLGTGQEKTILYSKDEGLTWSSITSTSDGVAISVNAGERVMFKATNASYASSRDNYSAFDGGTALYDIEGNIMSLIGGDNFTGLTSFTSTYVFCSLFKQSNAVSAENLILPVMTLTNDCYRAMFSKATYLTKAPELPATTLAVECYWYMFENCGITKAPELPAATLVKGCYGNMFLGCSSLNHIKCLATSITASSCTASWVSGVSSSGTFIKDFATTWTTGTSGIPTKWVVQDYGDLQEPTITFDGMDIELTCQTYDSNIYYRLNQSGDFTLYSDLISITADTFVEAYSTFDDITSITVSQNCVYSPESPYEASNKDLKTWTYEGLTVETPYSVNRIDGHSSSYAKGTFNFNTSIKLHQTQPTYLWFQHADQSATIYVDDNLVEKHWGGYTSFFVDITGYAHKGINNIKVALKNNEGNYLAPADGDFNFNATLGNVKLFTSPVLPDMSYGYDGFHVTSTASTSSATLNVKTLIPSGGVVVCKIDDDLYHYSDTGNSIGNEMVFETTIQNPHLWNGKLDPHLYTITLEVYYNGELYHRYQRPYGIRFYSYVINDTTILPNNDPYTGFLLNGQPYLLRGCCMHDDIDGKANALNDDDYTQTYAIIQELGCNFLRLAHYPHPKETYDWCDRLGIIVQTEGPCVNKMQSTMPSDYFEHLNTQYDEMVNQHYNHPCIVFWGLSNETTTDDKDFAKDKMNGYIARIRALDSSRYIGYVMAQSPGTDPSAYYNNPDADWFGCNIYDGWYVSQNSNDPTNSLNTRVRNVITNKSKMLGYSEYGCGGTQHCHSDDPLTTTTRGNNPRHDIEYMMWLHEGQIAAIKNFPQLVFTSQWQLFDIAVSKRNEGYTVCLDGVNTSTDDNLRRLNDKGLVERDHRTKKDPFYLYKAWWNTTDKFIHICGKDYTKTVDRVIKCYTNETGPLSLSVNGTPVDTATVTDNIATFTSRTFASGDVVTVTVGTTSDTLTFD